GSLRPADGVLPDQGGDYVPRELAGLRKLQAYVDSFVPVRCVDRAGNPIFDAKGNERMEKRVINTKELLGCKNIAEVKICLGTVRDYYPRPLTWVFICCLYFAIFLSSFPPSINLSLFVSCR
ncbi:hypothetical protein A2U01_0060135, partial [Trifolium medium]|nr:hypothetical protein [Trifolium medium]